MRLITDVLAKPIVFSQCPIQTKLIDAELLSVKEKKWITAYNAEVLEKVGPLLTNDERALQWLKRECESVF